MRSLLETGRSGSCLTINDADSLDSDKDSDSIFKVSQVTLLHAIITNCINQFTFALTYSFKIYLPEFTTSKDTLRRFIDEKSIFCRYL